MARSTSLSFARSAIAHQRQWAATNLSADALERDHILHRSNRAANLFRQQWWKHIEGREHRWARALNSSQCFGVNLFAPLADHPDRAKSVLKALLPERNIPANTDIRVLFEHTPPGATAWLGESNSRQPTQVDVFMDVGNGENSIGYVLIEVKYTESEFGCCRGWNGKTDGRWSNPARNDCSHAEMIVESPQTQCWLAREHGRLYWDAMSRPESSIDVGQIAKAGACPFRDDLYQLMRNRVLADQLAHHAGAWAEFAVCAHAGNSSLRILHDPVVGETDPLTAIKSLSRSDVVRDWSAETLVQLISETDEAALSDWSTWMRRRYFAT